MRKIASLPLYPLLLAVYPVTSLAAANQGQVSLRTALRPGILSLLAVGLLYLLLRLLVKDWNLAALVSALAVLLFFSYGHIYNRLFPLINLGVPLGSHVFLGLLWLALLVLLSIRLLRLRAVPVGLNLILNASCLVLLILAFAQFAHGITLHDVTGTYSPRSSVEAANIAGEARLSRPDNPPDVYYIILDGYAREDALLSAFGFDNRPFLDELRRMGFVIPNCAQSNYAYTALSIISTFFMDYQQSYNSHPRVDSGRDYLNFRDDFRVNPVRSTFTSLGYRLVTAETGYWWADIDDANVFLRPGNDPILQWKSARDASDFEDLLVNTTALRILPEGLPGVWKFLFPNLRTADERHYDLVRYNLDQLSQLPALPGPKFVYLHIIAPHAPFVFTADGSYRTTSWDPVGYAPELAYLNQRVLSGLREILAQSKTPPVIVVQGDHGWYPERLKILNAYYLPGLDPRQIPDTITPVNTFRLIFNTYFQAGLPLLPDRSYFSPENSLFKFEDFPSTCVDKTQP